MRYTKGFSIVELMIVVMLAAIILGLGAPSFAEFRRNNRISSAANDLLAVIQTSRSEAIKRQSSVSICPSADPSVVNARCAGNSYLGYIAFDDLNSNCLREDGEMILRVGEKRESPPGDPLNVMSDGNCISFAATGFQQPIDNAVSKTTRHTLFCDKRGMNHDDSGKAPDGPTLVFARGVDVSVTGRSRVTRDLAEIALWAPKVYCP